jgi:hypothetical protein
MTTSRPVRLVAVAALTGLAALSLQGVSDASTHHSTRKLSKPKSGLFVAGEPRLTSSTKSSAYAVDSSNYEHFVQFKAGSSATTGKIVYKSRKLGAKTWVTHNAPGNFATSGQPRLEIVNDNNRLDLDVVAFTCGGVYAVSLSHSTTRLAQFTKVSAVSDCARTSRPTQLVASFYNANISSGYLNIVVPDATTPGQWDLVAGAPGKPFTKIATVPTDDSFVPTQLVGYYYNGGTVVGQGVDSSGNKGVFASTIGFKYDDSVQSEVVTWTDLTEIATLNSPTKNYTIAQSTTHDRTTDVGLYLPAGTRKGQKHTLFVDTQDSSGQWSGPISIDGTTLHDRGLILSTSQTTGKLRATWLRVNAKNATTKRSSSGIMTSRLLSAGWTKAAFETHWYKDTPLSTTYDRKGVPHFFYRQAA